MNRTDIEEKLWNYIDGLATDEEKVEVGALVKADPVWKEAYLELLSVQLLLSSSDLEEPSMRFTRNVMEDIARLHITPATRTYVNKNIVYGLGIFFSVMIAGLLVFAAAQIRSSPSTSSITLPVDTDRIEWGKLFDSTYIRIFLMVNTVLVLMLLDRYLTRKKQPAAQQDAR